MDDVANAQSENANLSKIHKRLMQWDTNMDALAALDEEQEKCLNIISRTGERWRHAEQECGAVSDDRNHLNASTARCLPPPAYCIKTMHELLAWYDSLQTTLAGDNLRHCHDYVAHLETVKGECVDVMAQIGDANTRLLALKQEYDFVAQKTAELHTLSERLTKEQQTLQGHSDEILRRLHYFKKAESLLQRLQSSTLSVASDSFRECLNHIDESLSYLNDHTCYKDAPTYIMKYKQCLGKACGLVRNYVQQVIQQATDVTLQQKPANDVMDVAFALYYSKFQTSAAKVKRIAQCIESRVDKCNEYEQLLADLQQHYLAMRASIMSPVVIRALNSVKSAHRGDHCALVRGACALLVHVCQDEQRLYQQYYSTGAELLTVYLEGLCTILYDALRPFVIHINHLETLAEICSILRIEMLEEHVHHNPIALEAFGIVSYQLLQDVQERLVFRAHLYLQSDILNYNPSAGDLAYPEKLEMMESIALSLQETQQLRRTGSRTSLMSTVSSVASTYKSKQINSPADLHGMWYPTVRRTLVCLSRLYRCIDRPIFQGLSQEALKLCVQSVALAAAKIASAKTPIDGELFEIKHLLILREQIAPFRVDFTVKETSLDFSNVKSAALGLLYKRKQFFTLDGSNALLELLLDGTPQIKEHLLDSRKEVDRQLKIVCEKFIKDAAQSLIAPLFAFLDKAQQLLAEQPAESAIKTNYALRHCGWASPQQISSIIQESQHRIKNTLPTLQRAMQLYLSNRDTEFIMFRPIRNNVIQAFVRFEQLLTLNGYMPEDLTVASCPTADQVSVMLSSASILATESIAKFAPNVPSKAPVNSSAPKTKEEPKESEEQALLLKEDAEQAEEAKAGSEPAEVAKEAENKQDN